MGMNGEPVSEPAVSERTCSFKIDPKKRYLLHNETPKRIKVRNADGGQLVLSPLSQRVMCGRRLEPFGSFLRPLRQRHQLGVRVYREPLRSSRLAVALVWMVALLTVVVVADILRVGTLLTREAIAVFCVTIVLSVLVLRNASGREKARRDTALADDSEEGDVPYGVGDAYYDGNETVRRAKHILTLVTVVTIGAILPAIAIFVATDAKDFLMMEGGLRVYAGKESRLVSRMIQVTYTAILTMFPALLYFQFDRQRVGTMRNSWVRAIFRMDRRMETLSDVEARYGDQISEASTYSTDSVRFLGGRHSPIVVATILISLGWTLLVVRTESFDFAGATKVSTLARSADDAAERARDAASSADEGETEAAAAAGSAADQAELSSDAAVRVANESASVSVAPSPEPTAPSPATDQTEAQQEANAATEAAETAAAAQAAIQQPFFQLLVPTPSAATMAFLGAYFFAVYLILRGYFRGDLRPKIYNQITARLVTVVVLAYLINVLFSDTSDNHFLWILSFLAGVVPMTVMQRIGVLASSCAPSSGTAITLLRAGGDSAGSSRQSADTAERPADTTEKPADSGGNDSPGQTTRFSWLRHAVSQAFATPRLLTQIDGVDLQEASRLESEGYPDVTSLARSDLVSLMVNTRLPIERLVDWSDQAVLILLLDNGLDDELDERVTKLRHAGVRTASAVLAVAKLPANDPGRTTVEDIVSSSGGLTLDLLVTLINLEPAMGRILQWHDSEVANVNKPWPTIKEPTKRPSTATRTFPHNGHSPDNDPTFADVEPTTVPGPDTSRTH